MKKKKYKLTIAYDGTLYSGWQIQPNGESIQGHLERALKVYLKEKIRIVGAGRTDAGVHALAQVAHFSHDGEIDPARFSRAINSLLPFDIRIKEILEVPDSFHACSGAVSKIYHYHLWLEEALDPFHRLYRHKPKKRISLPLLSKAASSFLGSHDFTTFTNLGGHQRDALRTLYRVDIVLQEGGVRIEFEGDGFGYKMVRNIVGTLLAVAGGKMELQKIPLLFEAKDRRAAPAGAPPQGLFLVKINYE